PPRLKHPHLRLGVQFMSASHLLHRARESVRIKRPQSARRGDCLIVSAARCQEGLRLALEGNDRIPTKIVAEQQTTRMIYVDHRSVLHRLTHEPDRLPHKYPVLVLS